MARQFWAWSTTALAAFLLFSATLVWRHQYASRRWPSHLAGNPAEGLRLFQEKGCSHCHAVNGAGGQLGPDLGRKRREHNSLPQLVTAMWNHAPKMWERITTQRVHYPSLSYEQMAHLFTYLYLSRFVDPAGDPGRGRAVFVKKGCAECHEGGRVPQAPKLSARRDATEPLAWPQAMWNHAPAMQEWTERLGRAWPRFAGDEINDLVAFVGEQAGNGQPWLEASDPEKGWKVFRNKSCMVCHSLEREDDRMGPDLGPAHRLPPTFNQFAGAMWNHSPEMFQAFKTVGIPRPQFTGQEMASLIAFLYSLHYVEPPGSPQVGQSLFAWRGCARCHGREAEGTDWAPALRGRGTHFTSVVLGAALWQHGTRMHTVTGKMGIEWPTLLETDVGALLAFLNTPPARQSGPEPALREGPTGNRATEPAYATGCTILGQRPIF